MSIGALPDSRLSIHPDRRRRERGLSYYCLKQHQEKAPFPLTTRRCVGPAEADFCCTLSACEGDAFFVSAISSLVAGERMSHPHTRLIEQTNSGTSHFRPRRGQFGRNPTRPFVSDGRSRPFRRISRLDRSSPTSGFDPSSAFRDDPRPASCRSVRYRHPDRRKRGLTYYSIDRILHRSSR